MRRLVLGVRCAARVAAAAAVAACADDLPTESAALRDTFNVVMSEPQRPLPSPASRTSPGYGPALIGGGATYVSLLPGTVAAGRSARIRNQSNGSETAVGITDGGFDPVAVLAAVGDSIEVVVTDSQGVRLRVVMAVAAHRPPIVIRTVPPKGATDVPLNARIKVVFSEPMAAATITAGTVRLLRSGTPVGGQVMLSADGLRAEFVADAPLAVAATYTLRVEAGATDRGGEAVEAAYSASFVTESVTAAVARVLVEPASLTLAPAESVLLRARVLDSSGADLAGPVAWTASDSTVAAVHGNGWIVALTPGVDTITATAGGVRGSAVITVVAPSAIGAVRVEVATVGVDPDPNGYVLRLVGSADTATLGTNGVAVLSPRIGGSYRVVLEDVAVNCGVTGTSHRDVSLSGGDTVSVRYDVTCTRAGELVVVQEVDGDAELVLVRTNGTGLTRLTAQAGWDVLPAWSRDGSRIVFVSGRDGNLEIYAMNADGTGQVRLTSDPATDFWPAFSPDGKEIAFWSDRDGDWNIYVMNADGTSPIAVTNDPAVDADPTWSPDGTRIAFWSERDGNREIFVMNSDGTGVRRLTFTADVEEMHTEWSPDGSTLVFARGPYCDERRCGDDIAVMNADGTSDRRLDLPTVAYDPAWSPDSRWIVFAAHGACHWCSLPVVMAVRPDGTGLVRIVDGYQPAWRP